MHIDESVIQCPYCGEPMSVPIDPSEGTDYENIEDCAVCCRPILLRISIQDSGEASVSADVM